MIVSIKLFAAAKDVVGCDSVEVDVDDSASVGEVRERLVAQQPELAPILKLARIALNAEYVADSATVQPHDELAIIPPVSGG